MILLCIVEAWRGERKYPGFSVDLELGKKSCEVENTLVIPFSFLLSLIGVHYVFDTTIAADFSILESQREFVQRYQRRNQEEHALPMFASACPGENWFLPAVQPSLIGTAEERRKECFHLEPYRPDGLGFAFQR